MGFPQTSSPTDLARASDLDLIEWKAIHLARADFWTYRRLMRPSMKRGWFQRKAAHALQRFYTRLINGERPKLIIEAPPQHGKSETIVDFITWLVGKNPDLKTIYASFSDRLGVRANLNVQRFLTTARYKAIFPETIIPESDGGRGYTRNRELIEFVDRLGYFRNTTTGGRINGEGLDLGALDDVIKGREEANSQVIRDKAWDWLTDDFFSRFSEDAGLLGIGTRWHIDDPWGRLRKSLGDSLEVLSFPALATCDEEFRREGEPLFPELKSKEFLLERRGIMYTANWEALYQQNPQIIGGNLIKTSWFPRYKQLPVLSRRHIFVDTAQKTKEANDYSVFECWGEDDKNIYLLDVMRGKWEAPELRRRAKAFWEKHEAVDDVVLGRLVDMRIEDKVSGTGLIQDFRADTGIPVIPIERTTDKYTRLLDVLGYIEAGRVWIPESAPWLSDFLTECESFSADDSHTHDDQVDPMIDAIDNMLGRKNVFRIWENLI